MLSTIQRHESKTLNSCNATSKCDVSAEGWYSCTGISNWNGWTTGAQHVGYQGFIYLNPGLCGMPRNLHTAGGWRSRSWFEYKLLLILARPSHNNYKCVREKPDATLQLAATLNHIVWLKLECCLSDRPLLRLTSLAAWTCCMKRQNLTPALVNYPSHYTNQQSGLICSTLALCWKPDSHSHHDKKPPRGRVPDVVWENAPSAWGMLASPASKVRLGANAPPPIPGPAPDRGGKKSPLTTSKPKDLAKLYSELWQNLQSWSGRVEIRGANETDISRILLLLAFGRFINHR